MKQTCIHLWTAITLLASHFVSAEKSPNFILILTDDQGWSSLSSSMDLRYPEAKSDYHQTPHMDALLDRGMRFSNGYAASPVCSPTRYSIQFGKSPARIKRTRVLGTNRADHNQIAIPQVLRAINPDYKCAHIGKWHIDADPDHYEYDFHDGRTTNKQGGFTMKDNEREWGGYEEKDPKRVHSVTQRAIDFITDAIDEEKPFFVQLSHYAVHSDIVYSQESFEKTYSMKRGKVHKDAGYAAMIHDLDLSIGTLLEAYDTLGLAENTYIIFTSDNGGMPVLPIQLNRGKPYELGLNAPLLRGKWDLTEGGIRVPFAVMGPDIQPKSQSNIPVISYDLLPTLADLAGGDSEVLPENLDGASIKPLFKNQNAELKRAHPGLIFHFPHYNIVGLYEPHSAIRLGDYKLLKFYASDRSLLFKVSEDFAESSDLSEADPAKKNELEQNLLTYLEAVGAERPEESSSWKNGNYGETKTKFFSRYID